MKSIILVGHYPGEGLRLECPPTAEEGHNHC